MSHVTVNTHVGLTPGHNDPKEACLVCNCWLNTDTAGGRNFQAVKINGKVWIDRDEANEELDARRDRISEIQAELTSLKNSMRAAHDVIVNECRARVSDLLNGMRIG